MLQIDQTILLIIDVQGALAQKMHDKSRTYLHIGYLIRVARTLELPILYTEQAPDKIGHTISEITRHLKGGSPIVKRSFSCMGNPAFVEELSRLNRKQIVVCGIEAHVCVYQTVVDLTAKGYEVHVAVDAVSARTQLNIDVAIERMRMAGAVPTTVDTIACELIRTADHPKFKDVIGLMKEE